MMWLLLLIYIAHPSEGEHQMILRNGRNPCEGHVEIFYDNKWGYVGDKYWSSTTEQVVCRSTHCGNRMSHSKDVNRDMNKVVWLNELQCSGTEEHLWNCPSLPGWNISSYLKPTVKKIKCSNEVKMDLDGYKCAGAVRFSIDDGKSWTGYLCAESTDKWGKPEADALCKSLKCGVSKETTVDWMIWNEFDSKKKMMLNCPDIKPIDNLWQCVTKESTVCTSPVSVVCDDYERLQLSGDPSNVCSGQLEIEENGKWTPVNNSKSTPDARCGQMHCGTKDSRHTVDANNNIQLTCSDTVNVVLMADGKPSQCYGAVHINVSGNTRPVCGSRWNEKEAGVVCKELNCGKVIHYEKSRDISNIQGAMDNVNCLGSEASLWHCRAKRSRGCSSNAYVICADSIHVSLMDGPGECAGRVEVKYNGNWKQVDKTGWSDENSNTVCKQMKCGTKGKLSPEMFSKGSEESGSEMLPKTVACQSSMSSISECLGEDSRLNKGDKIEPVGIICEEHTMVFLKGDVSSPCSGIVGIEHDGKPKWLSGSNETWNQEVANAVCQQKMCGQASSFSASNPEADMLANIWEMSKKCLKNSTSQFRCATKAPSADQNKTVATVNCTGTVTFGITDKDKCFGHVVATVNGRTGGVCGDIWTTKHSEMLCMSQGCGSKVLKSSNKVPASQTVLIMSLHSTTQTTDLTQCSFVLKNESDKVTKGCSDQAYVVCSGGAKPKFPNPVDKCFGNVEVSYEGSSLPVCKNALQNEDVQHIICQELGCGQAVEQITYFGEPTEKNAISQLVCEGAKSLSDCNITSGPRTTDCKPIGLKCAEWRQMTVKDTCSGPVSIMSKEKTHAVSIHGWTETEGEQLCRDLKCESLKSNKTVDNPNPSKDEQTFWNSSFNCPTKQNHLGNIWDCEQNDGSPSLKKQLEIECTGKPEITLSGDCHGEVKWNGKKVCSTDWMDKYSHMVCQEKNCSNSVHTRLSDYSSSFESQYVRCDEHHHELSQCKTVEGKCNGHVSVYCVGSMKFNTTEYCGGQIRLWSGDRWENICPSLNPIAKDLLCKELGCNRTLNLEQRNQKDTKDMKFSLTCTSRHMDVKHCVTTEKCTKSKPAEIYCDGYKVPDPPPPPPSPPSIPVIVGVVLFLIMVILIVAFVRICIIKRARDNKRLRMMAGDEMEFESGDYEDVKEDEMEDKFQSESEIEERDARSTSSLPNYDDIDEVVETQPLTSQAAPSGASRDRSIQQDTIDQSDDGVTYEVDDPQENYDDIDVSPEITQTTAEVHDSLVPTPESSTVALPEVVQEDGDYVEPDQDG